MRNIVLVDFDADEDWSFLQLPEQEMRRLACHKEGYQSSSW
jgi:hypothetical protein